MWPRLEALVANKRINYLDLALARRYAARESESIAACLCFLSLALRKGHLCIICNDDNLSPPLNELLYVEEGQPALKDEEINTLQQLICKGFSTLPPDLNVVQKDKDRIYLQRYWQLESKVINELHRILEASPLTLPVDIDEAVTKLQTQGKLLPEQAEAILAGYRNVLTLITGGPGTGKTYTAGMLLHILQHAWENPLKIVLAAPTGKAAANLEASIKRTCYPMLENVKGTTLHKLLKDGMHGLYHSPVVIDADVVIIDECSMIDAEMMSMLLAAIKRGTRLIMLGDSHQLPSIEAGALFADLTEALAPHVTTLKTCMRTECQQLVALAEAVKEGDEKAFDSKEEIRFVNVDKTRLQHELVSHCSAYLPPAALTSENPLQALDHFNRFKLLTAVRKGPFGVESLNAALYTAACKQAADAPFLAVPIIIVKNDAHMDLFNGEQGVLIQNPSRKPANSIAFFPPRKPGDSARKIPIPLLPPFEYAYCLSVHKSQGSEYDHVLLLLLEDVPSFGREGLYTGISRARKQIQIWSRPEILIKMLQRVQYRRSGLVYRKRLKIW